MKKEILKRIIIERQEYIKHLKIFPRRYNIEKNANYVFVGSRRAGKSYLMYSIIQNYIKKKHTIEDILIVNFEDERLLEFTHNQFDLILECYKELYRTKPIIFFDEIQIIQGWEKFVRRLADYDYQIYITGSNAQMLSKEIASVLGGRFLIKEISTLTFSEYLNFNKIEIEKNFEFTDQRFNIKQQFEKYFYHGGFPETLRFSDKREYLSNLFQKVFFGDIIARYNIKNDFALRLLIKKLAESTMDETSFNRIKNIIKSTGISVGTATLIEYFSYLEDSFLIFSIKNYASKITERETKKKFYFNDTGLLNLFLMEPDAALLETLVYKYLRDNFNEDIYYYRTKYEVDFYIQNKFLIQVSYSIKNYDTRKREIKSILKISDNINENNLYIITFDEEEIIRENNKQIRVIPIWKLILLNSLNQ